MSMTLILILLGIYSPTQLELGDVAKHYVLGQEDYSVYSAAINEINACDKVKLIVLINQTKNSQMLKPLFTLRLEYKLISKEEADALCIQCADTEFYEKYADSPGYIKLSDISFNSQLNRASFLIERYCGSLCAEGIYVTLIKKNGAWIILRKEISWQS